MTGSTLYEKLRAANLIVPQMTDAEAYEAIERMEAKEIADQVGAIPESVMQLARVQLWRDCSDADDAAILARAIEIQQDNKSAQDAAQAQYLYELRDRLIVAAVTGSTAIPDHLAHFRGTDGIGEHACLVADATLAARKKP